MLDLTWLDDDRRLFDLLLAEMTPDERALFGRVSELGADLGLLNVLERKSNSLLTAQDLAAAVGRFPDGVEDQLEGLVEAGLARRVRILDSMFYGLTENPERRRLARDLVRWRDRWEERLTRMLGLLNGSRMPLSIPHTPHPRTAPPRPRAMMHQVDF